MSVEQIECQAQADRRGCRPVMGNPDLRNLCLFLPLVSTRRPGLPNSCQLIFCRLLLSSESEEMQLTLPATVYYPS